MKNLAKSGKIWQHLENLEKMFSRIFSRIVFWIMKIRVISLLNQTKESLMEFRTRLFCVIKQIYYWKTTNKEKVYTRMKIMKSTYNPHLGCTPYPTTQRHDFPKLNLLFEYKNVTAGYHPCPKNHFKWTREFRNYRWKQIFKRKSSV